MTPKATAQMGGLTNIIKGHSDEGKPNEQTSGFAMTEEQNKLDKEHEFKLPFRWDSYDGVVRDSENWAITPQVLMDFANRAEREPATEAVRLRLLERAYWIATGLNPAQDLGPDAMASPLTDEEIIEQAELTAALNGKGASQGDVLAALEEAARRYPDNPAVAFLFGAIGPTGDAKAAPDEQKG